MTEPLTDAQVIRNELGPSDNPLETRIASAADYTAIETVAYREPARKVAVSLIQKETPTNGSRGAIVALPGELAAVVENQRNAGVPTHVLNPGLFPIGVLDTVDNGTTGLQATITSAGEYRLGYPDAANPLLPGSGVETSAIALIEAAATARPFPLSSTNGTESPPPTYYGYLSGTNRADLVLVLIGQTVDFAKRAFEDFKKKATT